MSEFLKKTLDKLREKDGEKPVAELNLRQIEKLQKAVASSEKQYSRIAKNEVVTKTYLAAKKAAEAAKGAYGKVRDQAIEQVLYVEPELTDENEEEETKSEHAKQKWAHIVEWFEQTGNIDSYFIESLNDKQVQALWVQKAETWRQLSVKVKPMYAVLDELWPLLRNKGVKIPNFDRTAHYFGIGCKLLQKNLSVPDIREALAKMIGASKELYAAVTSHGAAWSAFAETKAASKLLNENQLHDLEEFGKMQQEVERYVSMYHAISTVDRARLKKTDKRKIRAKIVSEFLTEYLSSGDSNFSFDPKGILTTWIKEGADHRYLTAILADYLPKTSNELRVGEVATTIKRRKTAWLRLAQKLLLISMLGTIWVPGSREGHRTLQNSSAQSSLGQGMEKSDEEGDDETGTNVSTEVDLDQEIEPELPPYFITDEDQMELLESRFFDQISSLGLWDSGMLISYPAIELHSDWDQHEVPEYFVVTTYDELISGNLGAQLQPASIFSGHGNFDWPQFSIFESKKLAPTVRTMSFQVSTDLVYDENNGMIPIPVPDTYIPTSVQVVLRQSESVMRSVNVDPYYSSTDGTAWLRIPNSMLAATEDVGGLGWMYEVQVSFVKHESIEDQRVLKEPFYNVHLNLDDENVDFSELQQVIDTVRLEPRLEKKTEILSNWIEQNFIFTTDPQWTQMYNSYSGSELMSTMYANRHVNQLQATWFLVQALRTQGVPARLVRGIYNQNQDHQLNNNELTYWVQIETKPGEIINLEPIQLVQTDLFTKQALMNHQLGIDLDLGPHPESAATAQTNQTNQNAQTAELSATVDENTGDAPSLPIPQSFSPREYAEAPLPASVVRNSLPESGGEYQPRNGGESFGERRSSYYWTITGEPVIGYLRTATYSTFNLNTLSWSTQDMPNYVAEPHARESFLSQNPTWIPSPSIEPISYLHHASYQETSYVSNNRNLPEIFRPGYSLTVPVTDELEPASLLVTYNGQSISIPIQVTLIPNQAVYKITVMETPDLSNVSDFYLSFTQTMSIGLVERQSEHIQLVLNWPATQEESQSLLGGVHLPADIENLFESFEDLDDDLTEVNEIVDFVRTEFIYSLDPKWTDEYYKSGNSQDFFEKIFIYRKTDCDVAATATIALLRARGFEARLAVGFANTGTLFDTESNIIRGDEGHGWIEVKIDGEWVEFDPTPTTLDTYTKELFETRAEEEALAEVRREEYLASRDDEGAGNSQESSSDRASTDAIGQEADAEDVKKVLFGFFGDMNVIELLTNEVEIKWRKAADYYDKNYLKVLKTFLSSIAAVTSAITAKKKHSKLTKRVQADQAQLRSDLLEILEPKAEVDTKARWGKLHSAMVSQVIDGYVEKYFYNNKRRRFGFLNNTGILLLSFLSLRKTYMRDQLIDSSQDNVTALSVYDERSALLSTEGANENIVDRVIIAQNFLEMIEPNFEEFIARWQSVSGVHEGLKAGGLSPEHIFWCLETCNNYDSFVDKLVHAICQAEEGVLPSLDEQYQDSYRVLSKPHIWRLGNRMRGGESTRFRNSLQILRNKLQQDADYSLLFQSWWMMKPEESDLFDEDFLNF